MHQSKNNPHVLQEISTNILTKMSDITGSPHWACSENVNKKKLVTKNSVSTVCFTSSRGWKCGWVHYSMHHSTL